MRIRQKGFTLIELLAVIAIIATLAVILFPVFVQARTKVSQATCESNQKQIALAILQYVHDADGKFPLIYQYNSVGTYGSARYWPKAVYPYVKSTKPFACPDDSWDYSLSPASGGANGNVIYDLTVCEKTPWSCTSAMNYSRLSYGMNIGFNGGNDDTPLKLTQVIHPANTLLLTETWYMQFGAQGGGNYNPNTSTVVSTSANGHAGAWWSASDPALASTKNRSGEVTGIHAGLPLARHDAGLNAAFADGHTKYMKYAEVFTPPAKVKAAKWSLWHPTAP